MHRLEAPVDLTELPAAPGCYVLEFDLATALTIEAGRLGRVVLGPGRVRYYGSARGPGGLRARVGRHLRAEKRPHWHIDALTARAAVTRVLITAEGSECDLVRRDLASGRWRAARRGFGASDCRSCPAHLLIEQG